ncbi:MAG: cell division protein FtsZ [Cyclobacteriaceae bacterium]|nr:cell division protein FtsZ [Cyclobacteriaceae bacterium]
MSDNMYNFEIPKHHKSIIKVIGVGGGGSNAVNHMFNQGIKDVEFVVCNTDSQALKSSPVPNRLQIGINLTEGLGAGANPDKGENAAIESKDEIREMIGSDTKMVFVTAGMGGGTGTGAAPVIAKIAKEMDVLTVGIVTVPFAFEGKKKMKQAETGIDQLRKNCDTVLVILNDKLREIYGNLAISEAFAKADNVLTTGAKGIAEIITVPGHVNVDFQDVRTVMFEAGAAVMGSATMEGDDRALRAAEGALNSPLLNNKNIHGAQKILLSIISGEQAELQMDELTIITEYIQEIAGDDAEVIFGHGVDSELGNNIRVTVIATGFEETDKNGLNLEPQRKVFDLDSEKQVTSFNEAESDPISSENHQEEVITSYEKLSNEPPMVQTEEDEFSKGFRFDMNSSNSEEGSDLFGQEEEEAMVLKTTPQTPGGGLEISSTRKEVLDHKRRERVDKLVSNNFTNKEENYKTKFDVPAFERRKVKFDDVPHSSERNISRFNLNDDNHILGNNRFLHDNVD